MDRLLAFLHVSKRLKISTIRVHELCKHFNIEVKIINYHWRCISDTDFQILDLYIKRERRYRNEKRLLRALKKEVYLGNDELKGRIEKAKELKARIGGCNLLLCREFCETF